MQNSEALAACNTSVHERFIAGVQIISDEKCYYRIEEIIRIDIQIDLIILAETTILLDLIEIIVDRIRNYSRGKISIYCNNRLVYKRYTAKMFTLIIALRDGGSTISKIREK